jgi:hypothetical protein
VGTVTNGGFIVFDVVSGRHSITITAATDQTTKGFDAPAGSEVYIQVYDKSRMEGVAPALAGAAGGAVGGAIAAAAQNEAAMSGGEGRVWGVNLVAKADAMLILKGLSLSE